MEQAINTEIDFNESEGITSFLKYLESCAKLIPQDTAHRHQEPYRYEIAGAIVQVPALTPLRNKKGPVQPAQLVIAYPPVKNDEKESRKDLLKNCFNSIRKPKLTVTFDIHTSEDLQQLRSFIETSQEAANGKPLTWIFNVTVSEDFTEEYEALIKQTITSESNSQQAEKKHEAKIAAPIEDEQTLAEYQERLLMLDEENQTIKQNLLLEKQHLQQIENEAQQAQKKHEEQKKDLQDLQQEIKVLHEVLNNSANMQTVLQHEEQVSEVVSDLGSIQYEEEIAGEIVNLEEQSPRDHDNQLKEELEEALQNFRVAVQVSETLLEENEQLRTENELQQDQIKRLSQQVKNLQDEVRLNQQQQNNNEAQVLLRNHPAKIVVSPEVFAVMESYWRNNLELREKIINSAHFRHHLSNLFEFTKEQQSKINQLITHEKGADNIPNKPKGLCALSGKFRLYSSQSSVSESVVKQIKKNWKVMPEIHPEVQQNNESIESLVRAEKFQNRKNYNSHLMLIGGINLLMFALSATTNNDDNQRVAAMVGDNATNIIASAGNILTMMDQYIRLATAIGSDPTTAFVDIVRRNTPR